MLSSRTCALTACHAHIEKASGGCGGTNPPEGPWETRLCFRGDPGWVLWGWEFTFLQCWDGLAAFSLPPGQGGEGNTSGLIPPAATRCQDGARDPQGGREGKNGQQPDTAFPLSGHCRLDTQFPSAPQIMVPECSAWLSSPTS